MPDSVQLDFASLIFRMLLAVTCSGILGMERENKNRPAGFRTYMLVCLGACITMLLGQYEYFYIDSPTTPDVSRFGAQVINGIGFLGAGTIIVTNQQAVKGLTTAAGLWASACMGLAIGAGNYRCALLGFALIIACFELFPGIDKYFLNSSRNMNLYIEFGELIHIHHILTDIKHLDIQIREVDIIDEKEIIANRPAAIFSLHLPKRQNHEQIVAFLSDLEYVLQIEEI